VVSSIGEPPAAASAGTLGVAEAEAPLPATAPPTPRDTLGDDAATAARCVGGGAPAKRWADGVVKPKKGPLPPPRPCGLHDWGGMTEGVTRADQAPCCGEGSCPAVERLFDAEGAERRAGGGFSCFVGEAALVFCKAPRGTGAECDAGKASARSTVVGGEPSTFHNCSLRRS